MTPATLLISTKIHATKPIDMVMTTNRTQFQTLSPGMSLWNTNTAQMYKKTTSRTGTSEEILNLSKT